MFTLHNTELSCQEKESVFKQEEPTTLYQYFNDTKPGRLE